MGRLVSLDRWPSNFFKISLKFFTVKHLSACSGLCEDFLFSGTLSKWSKTQSVAQSVLLKHQSCAKMLKAESLLAPFSSFKLKPVAYIDIAFEPTCLMYRLT